METKILSGNDGKALDLAAEILRQGGLVAFPTETVYGLGASAFLPDAAKRIYEAKGRPSDNPLIVHLAAPEQAEDIAFTSPAYYKLAKAFMPGPLTVILPKKDVIPDEVTGGLDTVGIRVPSDPTANKLLSLCKVPVCAPSANLSGRPSTTTAAHVIADLYGKVDVVVDGGESEIGLESTIVALGEGVIKMLRPGAVTKEMIEELGFSVELDKAILEKLADGERPQAPGMKYRHYAPIAEVTLFDGDESHVSSRLAEYANIDGAVILCYNEDEALTDLPNALVIGRRADQSNTAHRLFAILRELDENKSVRQIYAALPSTEGMGLAIFNRLIKAAGYRVIKL